jgi:glycosyltransferase involved in cell wall biosynthesis
MLEKGGIAVVFWGPHSISTLNFARRLKATCYLIHYLAWKRPWLAPIKYPPMWIKTWRVLFKQHPSAVLVINTPVFAPLCVYIYCLLVRIPFAMNVHGHTLSGRKWGWSRPLQHFLAKKAAVNLVGTTEYKQIFESWGAKVLFLEDPPVEVPPGNRDFVVKPGEFRVTVVSTFAGDEPLDLVLEAARRLPEVDFFILGDTTLARKEILENASQNVVFPGYLKGNDYWQQLFSSQAILTLTTNPVSLVSGGTEGMYVGKPLILSRQPALVEYFTKGTVFVDHTVDSIVEGVQQAREHQSVLSRESAELAAEKRTTWESTFQEFVKILGEGHV